MKYRKGKQTYKLDDLPMGKITVQVEGCAESPWVRCADIEVVLLNDVVAFMPFDSWGVVLPVDPAEPGMIDVTKLRGVGVDEELPDSLVLTLHPEAWEQYLADGCINKDGEFLPQADE